MLSCYVYMSEKHSIQVRISSCLLLFGHSAEQFIYFTQYGLVFIPSHEF